MAHEAELVDPIETETPEPSLRDAIEGAFEKHTDPEDKVVAPVSAPAAPAAKPLAAPASPTPAPAASTPAKPSAEGKPGVVSTTTPAPVVAGAATPVELKPPASWRLPAKEKWNTLPREVQEEVARRETDNLKLIGSVGNKIRFADTVSQHLQPFAERLSSAGVGPGEFMGEIMGSVKALSGGTPQDKVEVVANIIQSYGVDLRLLDSMLSRRIQAPPEVQRANQLAAQAQRVLDGQRSQTQQREAQHHQQASASLMDTFAADPKNEFFEDVRVMMADLLESGQSKSMDDAYTAAIWANADTRKILLQREADNRAAIKQQRANGARRVSSSVSGAPRTSSAAPVIGQNMSLRDTIAEAIDLHAE